MVSVNKFFINTMLFVSILSGFGCQIKDRLTGYVSSVDRAVKKKIFKKTINSVISVILENEGNSKDIYVASVKRDAFGMQVVNIASASEDGVYYLYVPVGSYSLVVFKDSNKNGLLDRLDLGEIYYDMSYIKTERGAISGNYYLKPEGFKKIYKINTHISSDTIRGYTKMTRSYGNQSSAKNGLWHPVKFLISKKAGIILSEKYSSNKIPILFVHGANGSPDDWSFLSKQLKIRDRYQFWFYRYPSGMRLDSASLLLKNKLSLLQRKYGFKELAFVSHSMGGLVSKNFICSNKFSDHRFRITSFITLSTPWKGNKMAEQGAQNVPDLAVPSWFDVSSDSSFLKNLNKMRVPAGIPYYLFFSYSGDNILFKGSDDGAISLESQLDQKMQDQADKIIGVYRDHTGILNDMTTVKKIEKIFSKSL